MLLNQICVCETLNPKLQNPLWVSAPKPGVTVHSIASMTFHDQAAAVHMQIRLSVLACTYPPPSPPPVPHPLRSSCLHT